ACCNFICGIVALDETRLVRLPPTEDIDSNTRPGIAEHEVQEDEDHSTSSDVVIYCREERTGPALLSPEPVAPAVTPGNDGSLAEVISCRREGVSGMDAQMTNVEPSVHESSSDRSEDTADEKSCIDEHNIGTAQKNTDAMFHRSEESEHNSSHEGTSDSDDVSENEDICDLNENQIERFKRLESKLNGFTRRKRHFSEGDAQGLVESSQWSSRFRYTLEISSERLIGRRRCYSEGDAGTTSHKCRSSLDRYHSGYEF
ncbi:hypothetical protein DPMN_048026, partial [Dreissena polymorpha]